MMSNLEAKNRMSPWQAGIVVFLMISNVSEFSAQQIAEAGGNQAWLAVLLGGVLFYGGVFVIIKLADLFPAQTCIEYFPRIWGKPLGILLILGVALILFCQAAIVLQTVSREIAFFMFDSTPYEVLQLSLLGVCAYCALQDWGTVLRVAQVIFFTAVPATFTLLLMSLINIDIINFWPLWPVKTTAMLTGAFLSWQIYSGYEILLVLLPLVQRGYTGLPKALGSSFGLTVALLLLVMISIVGALSAEGAQNTPFPILLVMRAIEFPRIFIERLETYYLIFRLQVIFIFLSLSLYVLAQMFMRLFGYADHRPWVMALAPLLFMLADGLHSQRLIQGAAIFNNRLGVAYSLFVLPLTYILAKSMRRRAG